MTGLANRVLFVLYLILVAPGLLASDHADPIFNKKPNAGLTGLFVFPDGDHLVVILNIHPGLAENPPNELEGFQYTLFIDTHSKVSFDNQEDLLRVSTS